MYKRGIDSKLLGIYLNDHLAGSVIGVELAKRAADNNEGSELGDFLSRAAEEIESDRDALKSVMDHLGVTESRVKMPIAWAAEKIGRLKPNGQITGYSPLSRVTELEGLIVGITGKLALWRALSATRSDLGAFDLGTLIERAESQRDEVERFRIEAVREAFGASASAHVD